MIHEIRQAMYLNTPHGKGMPLFIIDYGPHINTVWVVANCQDGRIRHYDSNDITLTENQTIGINNEK